MTIPTPPRTPRAPKAQFLRGFPRTPELDALVDAFERGNFDFVRRNAPIVARESSDVDQRHAAHELLRRIRPDSTILLLLISALALFLLIVVWTYIRAHGQ